MYDSLLIYMEWWPHKYLHNGHYKVYFSLLNYSSEIQSRQSQELDDTKVNIMLLNPTNELEYAFVLLILGFIFLF